MTIPVCSDNQFYPTPEALVKKMLEGIDFTNIETILEPEAGKGDILKVLAEKDEFERFDVDCIEIDPNLREILKYNFSEAKEDEIKDRLNTIQHCGKYSYKTNSWEGLTEDQLKEVKYLEKEKKRFFNHGIHIVCDDFLKYQPFKHYDLIIMNPPFSEGDKHLLKALEIQKNGGAIVCLLNAETVRNPYTKTRQELVQKLREYNAQIEYIKDSFMSAERTTDVDIALIKVYIEETEEESDIYRKMEKAQKQQEYEIPENTEIEVADFIKAVINKYQIEVKAGIELIRQYKALCPYIASEFGKDEFSRKPMLQLQTKSGKSYGSISVNDYVRDVRTKYWKELLTNIKFIGKLTSKLQNEYREKVSTLKDYEFNEFNINQIRVEINAQIKRGIEDEIVALFDKLSAEHSWYPESKKNIHYYNGWKTNTAHKINSKVIIPCYGIWSTYSWRKDRLDIHAAYSLLSDIEKTLNYLDGNMTREVNLDAVITSSFNNGISKNIECKYFKVTFYKKGTCHIVFTNQELIDRFNIYVGKTRNWLPPCYGKSEYKDMTEEEKQIIDEFQGEEKYNEVMLNKAYYLGTAGTLKLEG